MGRLCWLTVTLLAVALSAQRQVKRDAAKGDPFIQPRWHRAVAG
jgi:hypothetical protein